MTNATIETSQIMALPEFTTDWKPQVGEIVENFGAIARVKDINSYGDLILSEVGGNGSKWIADPSKCRPVR